MMLVTEAMQKDGSGQAIIREHRTILAKGGVSRFFDLAKSESL
jgi:hypothetical protein